MAFPKGISSQMGAASTSHMDRELQMPEDGNLNYANPLRPQVRRPQGISTLSQWGDQVFPEGKYAGETFRKVYDKDVKYRMYMMNHSHLTSSWALSYQNYTRAMQMGENQYPVMPQPKPKAKASPPMDMSTPPWNHEVAGVGWELMDPEFDLPATTKRALSPEIKGNEMVVSRDTDREAQLMAKIAILQRELDMIKKSNES
jgi:hypothetical protein